MRLHDVEDENGGIADMPGNGPDPYHTFFGCVGLSLFGKFDLPEVNPVYAIPSKCLEQHMNK